MDFPADIQSFTFDLGFIDCNGDLNGLSYIDDCNNCVSGNTGLLPCVPLAPVIEVSFSNNQCNAYSDLEIIVSQTSNQPDMLSSIITTDGGNFDISSLSIGQVVGSASLLAAAGEVSFESQLIVESVEGDNQATLSSINIVDFSFMGSFTISNSNDGVTIFANQPFSDGNNVTAGNSSYISLNNIFVNPDVELFNLYTSINAEVGPSNYQSFTYEIECPCEDTIYTQNILLCFGESIVIGNNNYTVEGSYLDTLIGVNGCDSLLVTNLSFLQELISNESVTACDSYYWNGVSYAESGIYTFNTTNAIGCDSTAILSLTIDNDSSFVDITACDSFDWNGITYTESGVYTFESTNEFGCTDIATLNLTINNSSSSSEDVTSCDSFEWNGVTYTESGVYTFESTNEFGCTDIATLNLTINNSSSSSEDVTSCDSFEWNGITYTESGVYTFESTNEFGCTDIATLNLTINNSSSSSEDVTSCDSFEWNGVTYTESGVYTFESTNEFGCTDIATLNLTINNSSSSSEDVTSCDSFEWNGITYTESGVYTFESTNEFGCTDIATLNLTINNSSSSSEDVTSCDSFEWNGVTYTEDTFESTMSLCTDIATLNLTINNSSSSSEDVTS